MPTITNTAGCSTCPCPKGFTTYTETPAWYSFSSKVEKCLPPTTLPATAIAVGKQYTTVGKCSSSLTAAVPAAATCGTAKDVGSRNEYCGVCSSSISGCNSATATGYYQVRTCVEQSNTNKMFYLYSRSGCYDVLTGGLSNFNFSPKQFCNGSTDRAKEGFCWVPYLADNKLNCFPYDVAGDGQFATGGLWSTSGSALSISGTVAFTGTQFDQPANAKSPFNKTALVLPAVGGVGAAAVIGVGLFNRKRNLKKAQQKAGQLEPKSGAEAL